MSQSREENIESLTGLSKLWFELDSSILKPFLVHDWENCIKEHIELTQYVLFLFVMWFITYVINHSTMALCCQYIFSRLEFYA